MENPDAAISEKYKQALERCVREAQYPEPRVQSVKTKSYFWTPPPVDSTYPFEALWAMLRLLKCWYTGKHVGLLNHLIDDIDKEIGDAITKVDSLINSGRIGARFSKGRLKSALAEISTQVKTCEMLDIDKICNCVTAVSGFSESGSLSPARW